MKIIKQFRYYGDGDNRNFPVGLTKDILIYENIFDGLSISQLGIQGRPNTILYLNNSDRDFPIVIGETGIYEIDLQNYGQIHSIQFHEDSLSEYTIGRDRLLIDIIYEGQGV